MLNITSARHKLTLLFVILLSVVQSTAQQRPASHLMRPAFKATLQNQIPQATQPCSAEVAEWWQRVRAAAKEAVEASRRKDRAIGEAQNRYQSGGRSGDDVLSRKERDRLDADIAEARMKFAEVLKEGQEKSYRPPIDERAYPLTLYSGIPSYTEQARRRDISGRVTLRVEFRADGAIGDVRVIDGLGYGLDENAIKAIRQMIFLPALKEGMFLSVSRTANAEFNLAYNASPKISPNKPVSRGKSDLPAPERISPANGTVFDNFPRKTTLKWTEVPGAASYTVELDCFHCCVKDRWCTDVKGAYHFVTDLKKNEYTFNFVGAQPGRWRVWVIDKEGKESATTDWWTFDFTH